MQKTGTQSHKRRRILSVEVSHRDVALIELAAECLVHQRVNGSCDTDDAGKV